MRVNILALDGAFDTGLAVIRDAFATANEMAQLEGAPSSQLFEVQVVGVGREVRTALGAGVPAVALQHAGRADWVVVPAIGFKQPEPLRQALNRRDVKQATEALRAWSQQGCGVAAACIGTFVVAESGLLDGHVATTTWWLAPLFRQRYPSVELDPSRMVVRSGRLLTAGAALSHMDLALALVREASPDIAALVARYLVVDNRPSQSAYAISEHLCQSDPVVQAFERWARRRLREGITLDAASSALSVSKRTLARRTQEVLGKSPLAFFQDLRVEHAVHLLRTTTMPVERVAEAVGYVDPDSLSSLLRRRLGTTVRTLRRARH